MKAPSPLAALMSPAIAKWQYIEEKARSVLDAFCHREVRPLGLTSEDDLLQRLARLPAAEDGTESAAITRWYCFGATFGTPTRPVRRQLVAATLGPPAASLAAEICQLAITLLRESDIPAAYLRLTLTSSPATESFVSAVAALLGGVGERVTIEATSEEGTGGFMSAAVLAPTAEPLTVCQGRWLPLANRDGESALVGFVIELDAVVAALTDEDTGYLPAPSVVVAPSSPEGTNAHALKVAQRLRKSGIRTDLRHSFVPVEDLQAEAAAIEARLLVVVAAEGATERLTLINVADGMSETADLAELDRKVIQLLD